MEEGTDRRRYNLPVADEVAVIIPQERSDPGYPYYILQLRVGDESGPALTRINQNHPAYMPLLLPRGDPGWHSGLRLNGDAEDRLPQRAYYRYVLHDRRGQFSTLIRAGQLFQQYLCDAWAVCDQNKLEWLKRNQATRTNMGAKYQNEHQPGNAPSFRA
jgi:Helitron helicase-like domain at N-terminus